MKTSQHFRPVLFSFTAMLGTCAFTPPAAVQAQTPGLPPVLMTQPNATSLRLRINNPAQQLARLQVLDLSRDYCLLNETHREPAYGTLLKFNTLPAGRYAVLLRVGSARYRYTVAVAVPAAGATTIAVLETTTKRVVPGLATASL